MTSGLGDTVAAATGAEVLSSECPPPKGAAPPAWLFLLPSRSPRASHDPGFSQDLELRERLLCFSSGYKTTLEQRDLQLEFAVTTSVPQPGREAGMSWLIKWE